MTIYELTQILNQYPEDTEIIINHDTKYTHSVINDRQTIASFEHDDDGTPIIYINTEF